MSKLVLDDNDLRNRPVILDPKTGVVLPDDHPKAQAALKFWATTTLEERRAWHRFTCLQGQDPEALAIAVKMKNAIEASA